MRRHYATASAETAGTEFAAANSIDRVAATAPATNVGRYRLAPNSRLNLCEPVEHSDSGDHGHF